MSRRYKIILPIIAILLATCIYLAYSYALFTKTKTQEGENIVSTGCFSLDYEEGSYDISLTNSYPITDEEGLLTKPYTVTVKNNCTIASAYNLKLNILSGSNIPLDKVKINVISNSDTQSNKTLVDKSLISNLESSDITNSDYSSSYLISTGYLKAASAKNATDGGSITFEVKVWIDSSAGNEVAGLGMHANVSIDNEATDNRWDLDCVDGSDKLNCKLLLANGGAEVINDKDTPILGSEPVDAGLYKELDDLGSTYYFRGNVTDNYVSFAGYYWRVIRVNGDGSIRLIYDGKISDIGQTALDNGVADTNEYTMIGYGSYHSSSTHPKYSGYTFDNRSTITNSDIKIYLEDWYNESLSSYESYITDSNFCNDTSHAFNNRLVNQAPTFKCPADQADTYGGVYFEKIGLITADEIYFAGADSNWYLFNSYLDHQNNEFWTMTPYYSSDNAWVIVSPRMSKEVSVDSVSGVRPVISLDKEVGVTGRGTNTDPYVVSAN